MKLVLKLTSVDPGEDFKNGLLVEFSNNFLPNFMKYCVVKDVVSISSCMIKLSVQP